MRMKRKFLFLIGFIAITMVSVVAFWFYHSYHPNIMFVRMVKDSDVRFEEEYYFEWLMPITAESPMIPIASSIEDEMKKLYTWNDSVVTDLNENYVAPLHITVSGEIKDGKTTFWYEGYATTLDGETIEYWKEETFDHVFVSGDELFQ